MNLEASFGHRKSMQGYENFSVFNQAETLKNQWNPRFGNLEPLQNLIELTKPVVDKFTPGTLDKMDRPELHDALSFTHTFVEAEINSAVSTDQAPEAIKHLQDAREKMQVIYRHPRVVQEAAEDFQGSDTELDELFFNLTVAQLAPNPEILNQVIGQMNSMLEKHQTDPAAKLYFNFLESRLRHFEKGDFDSFANLKADYQLIKTEAETSQNWLGLAFISSGYFRDMAVTFHPKEAFIGFINMNKSIWKGVWNRSIRTSDAALMDQLNHRVAAPKRLKNWKETAPEGINYSQMLISPNEELDKTRAYNQEIADTFFEGRKRQWEKAEINGREFKYYSVPADRVELPENKQDSSRFVTIDTLNEILSMPIKKSKPRIIYQNSSVKTAKRKNGENPLSIVCVSDRVSSELRPYWAMAEYLTLPNGKKDKPLTKLEAEKEVLPKIPAELKRAYLEPKHGYYEAIVDSQFGQIKSGSDKVSIPEFSQNLELLNLFAKELA